MDRVKKKNYMCKRRKAHHRHCFYAANVRLSMHLSSVSNIGKAEIGTSLSEDLKISHNATQLFLYYNFTLIQCIRMKIEWPKDSLFKIYKRWFYLYVLFIQLTDKKLW